MLSVINPATEEVLATLKTDDEESLKAKFTRLKKYQFTWQQVLFEQKKAALVKFGELLVLNVDRLSKLLSQEMGKPIKQARSEIKSTPSRIAFFVENAAVILADKKLNDSQEEVHEVIRYEPLGVIANISAWNYPYFVGGNVFLPALLTGNCVLYKPSEFSSLSGQAMIELLYEAGIPQDALQVVIGDGKIGKMLLDQPIDGAFFTGSKATGLKIAAQVREKMIPLQLELGGKDPTYVAEDADLDAAAKALADGALFNAGQSCCSVERIYVQEKVYQPFLEKIVAEVQKAKMGDPLSYETYLGPLTRKTQLDLLDEQIKDAQEKGAKVLCGGKRVKGSGYYFEATVIADAHRDMSCMKDESFGPIVALQSVKNDEDAITQMNDTEYGLTAGVYSQSLERAQNILRQVNTGTAYVNCCDRVAAGLPWSGRKNSGIGSTLGLEGIRAFLKPKAWHIKRL